MFPKLIVLEFSFTGTVAPGQSVQPRSGGATCTLHTSGIGSAVEIRNLIVYGN